MKWEKINKVIVLLLIFNSYCTNPVEPPSLEELLYGTYNDAGVWWSANSIGNPIYDAVTTENSYLTINSDASYKMNLEIYVASEDTVFLVYQEGSYETIGNTYVKSNNYLTASYWKGTLKFTPVNQAIWEVEFSINKYHPTLYLFKSGYLFELPNSGGFLWVNYWKK